MRVCLFDIDGTLINTGGAGGAAMAAALGVAFGVPPDADGVPFSGRTDRAIAGDLFQLHGVKNSPENFASFRDAYLEQLDAILPRRQGRVLPGVARLLEMLGPHEDILIGLLTGNLRQGAQRKLEHYGLYHHFPFGGFGDDHLQRDVVARDAVAAAREHASRDLDVARILIIGDTPRDIQCARAVGAKAVAVATGIHDARALAADKPDLLLETLEENAGLLELLQLG